MEYFNFNRFLSVQIKMILVLKKIHFLWRNVQCAHSLITNLPMCVCKHMPLSLHISLRKKILIYLPRTDVIKCVLLEWLHWWHTFLCNLWEKRYVIFIISWHCSLGADFLADALRYLSWPALSRSWHLAASGMGLEVMSHQAGCWPHCITSTSVFLSKEAIWWPPWVEGSQILGTYSVLPYW